MDLRDYLRMARRNWIVITALALAGLLVGGTATALTAPTYTSQAELFVSIQNSGSVQELQQGNTFSQARVQSYVKTVSTPVVLQPAIDALGIDESSEALSHRVRATADLNTVIIKITASDKSPVQAAAIAQAVANSLITAIESLERPKTGGTSPVGLSIITPAQAPTMPSAPDTKKNLALGLVVGLLLGVAVSVTRSLLDNRIRGEADLRQVTEAPLLGGISFDPAAAKQPLLSQTGSQSPRAESFRQLRTNLQFTNVASRGKTVLVTSSLPGEGKSTTATNLAMAMAEAGQSVCLIDGDLRRPMVHEYLGLDRNVGLTTALIGNADVNDLLQPWGEDNLFILASGQIPPNPSELLGSGEMINLIQRLETVFDAVIIDAPPLLPVTDAAVLAPSVGGVILVVSAQKSTQQEVRKSMEALALVKANLLGVVLNRLPLRGPDAYGYSYYGSVEASSKSERKQPRVPSERVHAARQSRSPQHFPASHLDDMIQG